eukprot:TRINITY_DN1204_c0_g1_i2.p1 TRINITY_DN1204_c0_g1~~TRINITY_DN1204_c0_g1_i2.p1  ORF type:complete len:204 (-),score=25.37 TRINITY_DN1204_c0_g1_i2:722-1333(-)
MMVSVRVQEVTQSLMIAKLPTTDLLPVASMVVGLIFLVPFLALSFIYTYEYICNFMKRPKLRRSVLQVFNLTMLFFCYTRVWGCIHYIVNSQVGHTRVWGTVTRYLSRNFGLMAMMMSLAMVVSLWYDLVLSILSIDSRKSKSAKHIRRGLSVGGLVVFAIGIPTTILSVVLQIKWMPRVSASVFAIYTICFVTIACISVNKS